MAHPPARSSDLSFDRFLELVLAEGTKHIKLDFKMLEAVEPCLLALAQVENRLRKNGQVCKRAPQPCGKLAAGSLLQDTRSDGCDDERNRMNSQSRLTKLGVLSSWATGDRCSRAAAHRPQLPVARRRSGLTQT
eukprot:scaffold270507_cov31-Tisochrysis_lutea.AAC.3